MRMHATALVLVIAALFVASPAQAHLVTRPKSDSLSARAKSQETNLAHARYVCHRGKAKHKKWSCHAARGWLKREYQETLTLLQPPQVDWVARQIAAANWIGAHSARDPWPECPDPFDGGGSWQDTVNCENTGNWYDSPGPYRCGLQFDPMWERKFGKLCP